MQDKQNIQPEEITEGEGLVDVLSRSESKGGNLKVRLLIVENEDEEK